LTRKLGTGRLSVILPTETGSKTLVHGRCRASPTTSNQQKDSDNIRAVRERDFEPPSKKGKSRSMREATRIVDKSIEKAIGNASQ
jgi:hypothetical protein